ncbi:integrin alpha-PS3-like [Rhagoletis pomonella]|uniref:integrin alpha-PS3-like n=1 Tax=Rhagoletis pomonella TaxID=28610 RepID=UPI00177B24E9|nr:integrin alpha-PS3-like [Rhagoletis pomonella]
MHRYVVFCVIVWLKLFAVQSFNLAPKPNLIIRETVVDEINKINANDQHSSYFGYTIVLREKSVIIGAPRARTVEAYRERRETGGIYKYEFDNKTLKKIDFQNEMPSQTFASLQLNSTQQWLGGAMDEQEATTAALRVLNSSELKIGNMTGHIKVLMKFANDSILEMRDAVEISLYAGFPHTEPI